MKLPTNENEVATTPHPFNKNDLSHNSHNQGIEPDKQKTIDINDNSRAEGVVSRSHPRNEEVYFNANGTFNLYHY